MSTLRPVSRDEWEKLSAGLPKTTLTPEDREAVHRANIRAANGHVFLTLAEAAIAARDGK